jgi:protein transport protein SEC24
MPLLFSRIEREVWRLTIYLQSASGGKIICLQSTLPNIGTGALKPREDVKLLGTAKETTLLNAASPFYKSFAVDCSRSQVACDMLIFGGQYSDVATLSKYPTHYEILFGMAW